MNDAENEGDWVYTEDGAPATWTNFIEGQPNGGTGETCVAYADINIGMRDIPCTNTYYYICKQQKGSVTQLRIVI